MVVHGRTGYRAGSTSLTRQDLSKNGASGLYSRRTTNHPLPGIVWIQLPSGTPAGCSGPMWTVVEPSGFAAAAGVG